jgi:hypothetical protein
MLHFLKASSKDIITKVMHGIFIGIAILKQSILRAQIKFASWMLTFRGEAFLTLFILFSIKF